MTIRTSSGTNTSTSARRSRASFLMLAVLPAAAFVTRSAIAATDTWNPGSVGNGTTWDTTSLNWNNGTAAFTNGDAIVFDETGVTHNAITLANSVTISSLTDTATTSAYTISIAPTATVTDTGTVTIGQTTVVANTILNLTGGGSYLQTGGNIVLSGNNALGTAPVGFINASGLSSFTYNVPTGVIQLASNLNGTTLASGNATRTLGCLTLATGASSNNLLIAAAIDVGDSGGGNGGGTSVITLGSGSNTIQSNTIIIGHGKNSGLIQATAGGTVNISGTAGGATNANITIGVGSSGSGTGTTSQLNLLGANATVQAGNVIVGQLAGNTGGTPSGSLSFDTGNFTIATGLTIGTSTSGNSTGGVKGAVNIGSSAASTGVFNVSGNFIIGNDTNTGSAVRTDTANFTLNGGTVNTNVDITSNNGRVGTATIASTLSLLGGTLNMNGHQIGHVTGNNTAITNIVFPAANNSATLSNLGGTGINDAGITMNGNGTLIMAGNNTYTGCTIVSSGNMQVAGNITGSSGVSVTGGNLFGTGSIGSAVSINGGNISAGNGLSATTGNLTLNGGLTLNSGNIAITVSGSSNEVIQVNGPVTFNSGSLLIHLSGIIASNTTYTVLQSSTALSQGGLSLSTFNAGRATVTPTISGGNLTVTVSGGSGNLTWQGTDPSLPTQWDNTQSTHNWNGTAPIGDSTEFFDGDAVTFNGSGQGTVNISNTVSPGSMVITAGTYNFTGGNIAGSTGIAISGGANVTLNPGVNNTYTGNTSVNSSTLIAAGSGALGSGNVSVTNGTLVVNNASALSSSLLTLTNATLDNTSGSAITNSSVTPVSISGNLTFTGTNDLNLGVGTVALTSSPTITVSAGNFTLGGVTSGSFGVTKAGTGTLIFGSNANTFNGGVVINGGSVQVIGTGGKSGLGTGNTTVNSGGTLIGANNDAFGFTVGASPATIFINGGTVTTTSGAIRETLQDVHFTGGGTLTNDPGNTGTAQGQYSMNTGTVETDASSNQAVISAGCVSLQHGTSTFTVAQGTVAGGVDLLVSSNLINFNTTVGSVLKSGAGTMELTGNSTYTGTTTVSQGTLLLANAGSNNIIPNSSAINISSGATLDVSQITAGGGFVAGSSQAITNNGTVIGSVTANGGSTLTGTGSYGAVILGGGNLTAGTTATIGTLNLSSLTVSSGNIALKLSGSSHDLINVASAVNLSSASLSYNVLSPLTPGSYTVLAATSLTGVTGGSTVATLGRVTLTVDSAALASGSLAIDVVGTAANLTWTGSDPSLPGEWDNTQSANNWNRTDAGTTGNAHQFYDGDNVVFDNTGVQGNVNIATNLNPGSTVVNSGNYTFNGSSIGGIGVLTVNGGTLTINNTNSYTGVTTINTGGTISLSSLPSGNNPGALGNVSTAAANLVINGGTLLYTGGTASTDHLFTVGPNGATISSPNGQITFSNTGALGMSGSGNRSLVLDAGTTGSGGGVINSVITDAAGSVTSVRYTGNGTWTASATNTYTGSTTINAGTTLKPGNSNSLGAIPGGNVVVNAGGTVDLGGNTTSNGLNFGLKPFHISGTGNGTTGYGAITNTGISQQNSLQSLTLDNNASVGSSFGTGSQGRIDVRSSTTTLLNATVDLQGHTLTKVGTSQLSIVGANITQGNIDVQGGLLSLETVTTTNGTGSITFEPGTLSGFFNNTTTTSANTTVGGLTWPLIYMGNNTIGSGSGAATVVGAPIILMGNVTLEPIATNAPSLTANDQLTLNGNITQSGGNFSMTKVGVNTTFFGGSASTYSGGLFIQQGNIALSGNNGLSPNSIVTFGASGTNGLLDLNGFSTSVGGLATDPNAATASQIITDNSTNASTLTFLTATSSFGGILQNGNGTLGLTVGSGNLTLTAADTYTGATTVNAGGILNIASGASISSSTNVTNNGTLNFANGSQSLASLSGNTTAASVNLNATALAITGNGTYAGSINDGGTLGSVTINSGVVQTTGSVNVNSLTVNGTQKFTNTTIRTLSKVNTLTVAGGLGSWTGGIDLTNSRLIVEDSSASRASDIAMYKNMVANSVNGTVGIYSSVQAADPSNLAVVVSDNAIRMATFSQGSTNFGTGVNNVDANSILITTTFKGDFNLDGVVDLKDLQDIANHWQQTVSDWSQGDVDGNGKVELQDLQAVANHWQTGVGAPGAGSGSSSGDSLALVGGLGGSGSAVPEPASLAMLAIGGAVLATRRRKA